MTTIAAVIAVYALPQLFPDPQLAFYVLRGLLGCYFGVALFLGVRVSWPVAAVVCVFEGSSAVCGALYAAQATPQSIGLCDEGSGLQLTLLALTGVLAAVGHTIKSRGKHG